MILNYFLSDIMPIAWLNIWTQKHKNDALSENPSNACLTHWTFVTVSTFNSLLFLYPKPVFKRRHIPWTKHSTYKNDNDHQSITERSLHCKNFTMLHFFTYVHPPTIKPKTTLLTRNIAGRISALFIRQQENDVHRLAGRLALTRAVRCSTTGWNKGSRWARLPMPALPEPLLPSLRSFAFACSCDAASCTSGSTCSTSSRRLLPWEWWGWCCRCCCCCGWRWIWGRRDRVCCCVWRCCCCCSSSTG